MQLFFLFIYWNHNLQTQFDNVIGKNCCMHHFWFKMNNEGDKQSFCYNTQFFKLHILLGIIRCIVIRYRFCFDYSIYFDINCILQELPIGKCSWKVLSIIVLRSQKLQVMIVLFLSINKIVLCNLLYKLLSFDANNIPKVPH